MNIKNFPKGYKGFTKEVDLTALNLEYQSGLCVITGQNGSGKTQLLKHCRNEIIKNHKNNQHIVIFKTTDQIIDNSKYYSYESMRNRSSVENSLVDNIIDEILSYSRRRERIGEAELNNILFNIDNEYYSSIRKNYESIITEVLKKYLDEDDVGNILKNLGYPQSQHIKKHTKEEYRKDKGIKSWRSNATNNHDAWFNSIISNEEEKNSYFPRWINEINKSNTSMIKEWEKFIDNINDLDTVSKEIDIEKELASIIEEDFKIQQKTEKTKYAEINNHLDKVADFRYLLVKPQRNKTYKLIFKKKDSNEHVFFNDLSTGERALFQLIYYKYSLETNSHQKYLFLDEFDANFNPSFIAKYIEILKEIKDKIKVVITTHNPITVIHADPEEIFELCDSTIVPAINQGGKRKILNNLAPNFYIDNDLGSIGMVFGSTTKNIIFVEGKKDKVILEDAMKKLNIDRYTVIQCTGAENIIHIAGVFKTIEPFKKLIKDKNILCLFDADKKGSESALKVLTKGADANDFIDKRQMKIAIPDINMYVMLLLAPDYCKNPLSKNNGYGWQIENLHLSHNEEDYRQSCPITDKHKDKVIESIEKGEYEDYRQFKALFNSIDELIMKSQ